MNKFLTLEYIRITDEGNTVATVALVGICSLMHVRIVCMYGVYV